MIKILYLLLGISVAHAQNIGPSPSSSGGSGTPGGTNGQVQINNAGSFGGITPAISTGCQATGGTIGNSLVGLISTQQTITALAGSNPAITTGYCGGLENFNNGSNQIPTIAVAGSAGFAQGWYTDLCNINAGTQTVTPASGTIGGANTYVLAAGTAAAPKCVRIISDAANTNYVLTFPPSSGGGSGNALFGTTSGNTANDIVTMSNTTVGVQDSGTLLSSLAPKVSPTFSGTVTGPDSGTWASGGLAGVIIGATSPAAITGTTIGGTVVTASATGTVGAPNFVGSAAGTTTGFYFPAASGEMGFTSAGTVKGDYGITTASVWTFKGSGPFTTNTSITMGATSVLESVSGPTTIATVGVGASTAGAVALAAGTATTGTGGAVTINAGNTTAGSNNGGGITLTPGTSSGGATGSITLSNLPTATGSYVCSSNGVISVEATACPASDIAQKNPLGTLSNKIADSRLDMLSASLYTYKDTKVYGEAERVGLYAQDVEKMDPRCVTYKADGSVSTYDDRCVIAYLVADRQHMKAEIEELKHRVEH